MIDLRSGNGGTCTVMADEWRLSIALGAIDRMLDELVGAGGEI
jgi:hypothetical protein